VFANIPMLFKQCSSRSRGLGLDGTCSCDASMFGLELLEQAEKKDESRFFIFPT
jgi:hypothetical protein